MPGFHQLYHLRFAEARAIFLNWQRTHPADPLGHAAEAASHLFEEFEQHGVLTTEFFLDDDLLLGGIKGKADAARTQAFEQANARARKLATGRDATALLALTLVTGMAADYAALITKRQIESLRQIRDAENYGQRLLAVAPQVTDGYVALGAANYILAAMPSYKRALLWFGGMAGNKQRGMDQLSQAARGGPYLGPYAKTMLALVCIREKRNADARRLMNELTTQFPDSPLFARERSKIEARGL
ncbi:MAG: hypothetical protein ABIR70_01780 [Bryobacteraceae bacterium]